MLCTGFILPFRVKRLTGHGHFRPRVRVSVWYADIPKAADLAPDLLRAETLIDGWERREEEIPLSCLFGRLSERHSVDEPAAGFVFLCPACCLSVVCHLIFRFAPDCLRLLFDLDLGAKLSQGKSPPPNEPIFGSFFDYPLG